MAIGVLLLFVYVIFLFFIIEKIYKGDAFYLLLYIIFFIPFYSVFQLIILKTTQNIFLIELIKYSKDFIIFSSFIVFVFGHEERREVRFEKMRTCFCLPNGASSRRKIPA